MCSDRPLLIRSSKTSISDVGKHCYLGIPRVALFRLLILRVFPCNPLLEGDKVLPVADDAGEEAQDVGDNAQVKATLGGSVIVHHDGC